MTAAQSSLIDLHDELTELRHSMLVSATPERVGGVHPSHRISAENLLHYVALRQHDVRELQRRLTELGLSSLGRAEADALAGVDAVLRAVRALAGLADAAPGEPSRRAGDGALKENARRLLGPAAPGRGTRIMVTLPSDAARDPDVARRIVEAGAELIRINCAHDQPADWRAMSRHVRRAAEAADRQVRIVMDLAGPKVRTGPIADGRGVVRLRPVRDELGRAITPALVWLGPAEGPAPPGAAVLPIADLDWLARRRAGDEIVFHDTRGSQRVLEVVDAPGPGVLAEVWNTAYVVTGMRLGVGGDVPTTVGPLPPLPRKLRLDRGDELHLVPDLTPVDPEHKPAVIGCTAPAVFHDTRPGDRISFDDGKVAGCVEAVDGHGMRVRITDTAPGGSKLGAAKGVNLPDTVLQVPALTEEDRTNLATVVQIADAVSLSFVRSPEDVEALQHQLARLGHPDFPLILKVETVPGFEKLPEILLAAMRSPCVGVMIARGDLAVEAGYARLAEVQEEILWLAEAAHVPVVWATQVLDNLARTGRPSRAEVTDAAMAGRAECVMLNQGPYVADAVAFLDDILRRMSNHQRKKSSLLRQLHSWADPTPAVPEAVPTSA